MNRLIVSRHLGAIKWIARHLSTEGIGYSVEGNDLVGRVLADVDLAFGRAGDIVDSIPIKGSVTEDDVKGKYIIGNIPVDLAAFADLVAPIVFPPGKAPRGQEYTDDDMIKAGAKLAGPFHVRTPAQLQAGGYCI